MVKAGATKKKSNSGTRRLIGGVTLLFLVCLIGFSVWFFRVGDTKEIVAVADQFKPDPSWQLETNDVQPPKTFCGDVDCPRVYKVWSLSKKMSKDDFVSFAYLNNVPLSISSSCFEDIGNNQILETCDATGNINGYKITLSYMGNGQPSVSLIVGKTL